VAPCHRVKHEISLRWLPIAEVVAAQSARGSIHDRKCGVGQAAIFIDGEALTGRTTAAGILLIAGVALVGTIDNLVRPYLARRGRLELPTYVVLVAMFGGIVFMGGWGVLIAPLVVRLAKEALSILRETRADATPPVELDG